MSNVTQMTAVPADMMGVQGTAPVQPTIKPSTSKSAAKSGDSSSRPPPEQDESPQRLVISEGSKTGVYIYTILDRATGQVLVQIPREEVVRIASRPDYKAGKVIDTKV